MVCEGRTSVPTGVEHLVAGAIVTGPLLPEPVEVLTTVPMGSALKLIARGLRTNLTHQPVLDAEQIAQLTVSPKEAPFDGDALRFRLGIEGHRLGLAYEYDPYFSLSIARIDPLPHQLEAVYEYFLKVPRIRFLLADDPGSVPHDASARRCRITHGWTATSRSQTRAGTSGSRAHGNRRTPTSGAPRRVRFGSKWARPSCSS